MQESISLLENQIPVVEGLFIGPSKKPQLIGRKCKSCDSVAFPAFYTGHNPECKDQQEEEFFLSRQGVLYSYTIHHYPPPPPIRIEPFKPYAIGLVELPEKIRIMGLMTGVDIENIKIGTSFELTLGKLYQDDNEKDVMTYMWQAIYYE